MRILKYTILTVLSLVAVGFMAAVIILQLPQFGTRPQGQYLAALQQSAQHNGEVFVNEEGATADMGGRTLLNVIKAYMNAPEGRHPDSLPILHPDPADVAQDSLGEYHLTWFGHSSFLLEVDNKNILLDPMLGPAAAPFSFQVRRFSQDLPITMENLPQIDAVIFSHDHYDHLDHTTILAIKDKVSHFYVPLGLKGHLVGWGVDSNAVTELDWWEEVQMDDIRLACTPSQHFSGRGLTDRNTTLWCSWVITTPEQNIYFSGDSGYFKGFKSIGEKYGPFDLALIECGQYNELWQAIHMLPEQSAQAAVDLNAKAMIPIHWGMFELALHPWKEPAERVTVKAKELGMPLLTPKIGERLAIREELTTDEWWNAY
ncbi:MAG: MBL fold metallo-hydrolase [Flavobacteriales bacterium]|nr:MBL fold metallo-hydrolase [Flavobacteriales bacterium]